MSESGRGKQHSKVWRTVPMLIMISVIWICSGQSVRKLHSLSRIDGCAGVPVLSSTEMASCLPSAFSALRTLSHRAI